MPLVQLTVAFHHVGTAKRDGSRLLTTSEAGRMIDAFAARVERVVMLAYDTPANSTDLEDDMSYQIRSSNVEWLSLGPKGSRFGYIGRRRRLRQILRAPSASWSLLVLRFANRRGHLVWSASRCPRVVVQIGGSPVDVARNSPRRRVWKTLYAMRNEANQRHVAHGAGLTFVVSSLLADSYRRVAHDVVVIHESSLDEPYVAHDRFDTGSARVLTVGRLSAAKGSPEALRVFARFKADVPDATLDVVGAGESIGELRRLASELNINDAVTFHGWITNADDLRNFYARSDVLLHLSHVENMPRVIWEALACSVLVVTTSVGSIATELRDETHALFVPVRDEQAAVDALCRLTDDPDLRRKLLANGLDIARGVTLPAMVDGVLDGVLKRWPELEREVRTP